MVLSLLCKPEFSLTTHTSFIKNTKHNYSSTNEWWESTKSSLEGNTRIFSENSRKYQTFNTEKKTAKLVQKKKKNKNNFKPEIKPMIENLQDEFQRPNQQKVLNFMLTLNRNWRTKNAPKLSSKYLIDRICKIKQYLN